MVVVVAAESIRLIFTFETIASLTMSIAIEKDSMRCRQGQTQFSCVMMRSAFVFVRYEFT